MYEPENIFFYFDELEHALRLVPDYPKVYNAFNTVFRRCLEQKTATTALNLVGTFAQTDYLLKASGASPQLIKSTNDTRVRLRKRGEIPPEQMQKHYLYDFRNLCRFIAWVCHTEIPPALEAKFPTVQETEYTPKLVGDYLRVIVDRWDDEYLYVQTDVTIHGELTQVGYAHNTSSYDFDWTYLKALLYQGAQLNLIRPREKNGIVYPELIIFEPDYLVDISTVSRCFENYAESPMVNLIKKLQPAQNTEAIVLGNFAGQLLDETLHQLPQTHSYAQSVKEFFKNNAINLSTAGIGPDFHNNAKQQKLHIAHAMNEVLPSTVSQFDPKDGMVEPSFFSEMLGLQGRMDYLQLDFRVLLEQKSGKGAFPSDHPDIPKHKEDHYVQMLLYMAIIRYNYREVYEKNNRELHAFLLYSRYKESLIGLGFAPELIFRAIKVRNGIAWAEMQYARPNGFRILDTLTPEKMNMKQVDNPLWNRYQSVQIAEFLNPIQQSSKLEKAYFFRFLTFIANEHLLSKFGNKTKENSGFASKWHDSLEEKLQAGNIYDRLTLISPNSGTTGNIQEVKLRFSEYEDNYMSNFRTGDIVILYPYEAGKEPDVRTTMVFRSTIEDITTDNILLKLRANQTDARIFLLNKDKQWAIEHDFLESSYNPLYRGMYAFLSAPKERKELLLLKREPTHDSNITLKGDYGKFNDLSLKVKQAKDFFLIIGPPGAGKTSYGMLNTLKEELLEENSSILLLSYTNRAVDEICSKLLEEGIDFIRIGGRLSCSPEYRDKLLDAKVQNCPNINEVRNTIISTRVFAGTTSSLNANIALFQLKKFSLAIIDEASQILEPHLIGLLSAHSKGIPVIRKFVFIGDHKQLPAVVQQTPDVSRVEEPELRDILLTDCRLSLFERLLKKYGQDESVTYLLRHQGRMHHDIARFPNQAFYNNALMEIPLPHQHARLPQQGNGENGIEDLLRTRRIAFIAAEAPQETVSKKVNQTEADIIAATVLKIYEMERDSFEPERTVGVIVPYRNQIATIRNTLDKSGIPALHDITIDTVERFQGSQRKYIIYGFTIQEAYQLKFLTDNVFEDKDGSVIDRKLNVAVTRAREHLILVGNAQLLAQDPIFSDLMIFIRKMNGFFQIKKEDYITGNFIVPPMEANPD